MTSPKPEADPDESRKTDDLDRRYGQIGISAVAAALRCKPDNKTRDSAVSRPQR